jgi:hypothetical protein
MGPLEAVETMPECEARRRRHVCLMPAASGVTAPRPVTTTLRMAFQRLVAVSDDYFLLLFLLWLLVVEILRQRREVEGSGCSPRFERA